MGVDNNSELLTWDLFFMVIRNLFVLYVVFAILHVIYKISMNVLCGVYVRNTYALPVPHGEYDSILGRVPYIMNNTHRLHDFRLDSFKACGFPEVKTIGVVNPILSWRFQLMTADPVNVKYILKDAFEDFDKFPDVGAIQDKAFKEWLGGGIFTQKHEGFHKVHWLMQRKTASHIFSRRIFNNNMRLVFLAKAKRLVSLLKQEGHQGAKSVDMQHKFFAFTMDSIMEIFFNKKIDTMGGQVDRYATAFDGAHRSFMKFILSNIPKFLMMSMLPWPFGGIRAIEHSLGYAMEIFRKYFSVHSQALTHYIQVLREESAKLIQARREDPDLEHGKDLLALFMKQRADALGFQKQQNLGGDLTSTSKKTKGDLQGTGNEQETLKEERFTDALTSIILNMIIAGRDTTACLLTWLFWELSLPKNAEIQDRLFKELEKGYKTDEDLTFSNLNAKNFPYLNACIYETLRLHPPVPFDPKFAVKDTMLPDGTKLPKHAQVIYVPFVMNRDTTRYGPDAESFRPERWIPFKQPNPYEFPVFQAGPRVCLGQDMAIFEAKLCTAVLVKNFRFGLDQAYHNVNKTTYSLMVTMSMATYKEGEERDLASRKYEIRSYAKTREGRRTQSNIF